MLQTNDYITIREYGITSLISSFSHEIHLFSMRSFVFHEIFFFYMKTFHFTMKTLDFSFFHKDKLIMGHREL
jgi:hypothetical protein